MIAKRHLKAKLPKLDNSPNVLLVVANFYSEITELLVNGAKSVLNEVNANIETITVPGALEIPTAVKMASESFDGFVALGCVIRGETSHYETVTKDSSRGLTLLGLEGICIGNGILTVENLDQAEQRANPLSQNKGGEAAVALINLLSIKNRFSKTK